ncbi:hypothetical protein ID866_11552, partial [Astraeus odoratus]
MSSLKLKDEIVDLDFAISTDHRKCGGNCTTQACLNCRTLKHKCDHTLPCQKCIQLGYVDFTHIAVDLFEKLHQPNLASCYGVKVYDCVDQDLAVVFRGGSAI